MVGRMGGRVGGWFRAGYEGAARATTVELSLTAQDLVWTLGSLCALHGKPFSAPLLEHTLSGHGATPLGEHALVEAAQQLGFRVRGMRMRAPDIPGLKLPMLVRLKQALPPEAPEGEPPSQAQAPQGEGAQGSVARLALVTACAEGKVVCFAAGTNRPITLTLKELQARLEGQAWMFAPEVEAARDADAQASAGVTRAFGFRWFVPELLRHRRVWRDVLLASLALQIVALSTPLITQAIIDKVVVHRTHSTLIALGVAMALFIAMSAVLSWGRQYLVLHTGNRVDAVLGAAVWAHLLKLPPAYFAQRPTGVVAARLGAVENIREFVSGAAISLLLDLPFLFICLGIMLWYSASLSALAVGILLLIALASAIMAPVFQRQLNEQFMLGARNQAFVTEHIAGFETVKTLQMEPQLRQRHSGYLAALLASAFRTKQTANTYNTFATAMEQTMTMGILLMGAHLVMTEPSFTIGMLVAFQMFASKLSQPVMRIVGLWTQFQQASLSVKRLGDVMNAPAEPYSLTPQRQHDGAGAIEIIDLGFRHSPEHPLLYSALSLKIAPGQSLAIMGPSGCGKSTLARLLLGFHHPTQGSIRIDGIDLRHLSANELRAYFGVVPQETILFSGTILANLQAAQPAATLAQAVQAARMAGIHEVIEQLPQGYQSEIGERGVGLSGGQKQRLAIARALLKRPKVLIFDEATSALDAETAEAFAQTINQLKGKVTMIFITHALPKALRLDAVLHLGQHGVHSMGVNTAATAEADAAHKGAH